MLRPFAPGRSRDLAPNMQGLLALAFALVPRLLRDDPVPPPAGSGAHVTSTLATDMAIKFTAGGQLLRNLQQHVDERSDLILAVVEHLADGLAESVDANEARTIASGKLEVETTRAKPPYVRVLYGKCTATVDQPGDKNDPQETSESGSRFFIERGAADAKDRDARPLYANSSSLTASQLKEVLPRVAVDADAFVAGPRLAPLVLGRKLAPDAPIDVPPALLAPLFQQAVPDGTLAKATLVPQAAKSDDRLAFKISAVVTWKGGEELPVTATFTLDGVLELVKATAQVSALHLAGPIQYGGTSDQNGAKLEIAGTGSLDFDYHAEPLPKN